MKRKLVLTTLLPLLLSANGVAQELIQQVTWQATATKDTPSTMTLLHPGQQPIVKPSQSGKVLAARLTAPDSGLKFQARALTTAAGTPSVTLNGQTLTRNYQPVAATGRYYLDYQQKGPQADSITESGYELVAYW